MTTAFLNSLNPFKGKADESVLSCLDQERIEADLVAMYRGLQASEAEHKVSRLNARSLNQQLNEAIDRERELADEVALKRTELAKAMNRYENVYGDDIAVAAEGQVITRGLFSFIRRKLVAEKPAPVIEP